MGKLTAKELEKLLNCIPKDSRIVVPPSPGFDSGVHVIHGKYLVVSTDPCIGAPKEWFGWLLVHYAASDVALFGATPEFCTLNLLGPAGTDPRIFYRIMAQACEATKELNMAIVTGHTGTYGNLSTMIGVCTAYGTVTRKRLRTPANAKAGDCIICTKNLGLEIAVNLSLTSKEIAKQLFGKSRTETLSKLVKMQSCVNEAISLSKISGVHAMHDTTEGGLLTSLNEMASASGVGFRINFGKIPFAEETHILEKHFDLTGLQMLSLSSTGSIIAAVSPCSRKKVEKVLHRQGVKVSVIGIFTKSKKRILTKNGMEMEFPSTPDDPYGEILGDKQ